MTRTFPLPPALQRSRLPYVSVKIIMGCEIVDNWKGDSDSYAIFGMGEPDIIHADDFRLASHVAEKVANEYFRGPGMKLMWGVEDVLKAHRKCADKINVLIDDRKTTRIISFRLTILGVAFGE